MDVRIGYDCNHYKHILTSRWRLVTYKRHISVSSWNLNVSSRSRALTSRVHSWSRDRDIETETTSLTIRTLYAALISEVMWQLMDLRSIRIAKVTTHPALRSRSQWVIYYSIFRRFRYIFSYVLKFKEVAWPEHIPFGGNLSCMHYCSSVSISTYLKC